MRRSAADAPRATVGSTDPNAERTAAKRVEREAGDPEGNLVIVERVARKRQHHFSCREYGWVGTAHRFGASTAWTDGTRKNGSQFEIGFGCGDTLWYNEKIF